MTLRPREIVTVAGANQEGDRIAVNAQAGLTLAQETTVTFLGCRAVEPVTLFALPWRKSFILSAPFLAQGTDEDVLQLSPPFIGPGSPHQNVTCLPANSAQVFFEE